MSINVIDYRNGGMGNTILAHVLFSCNKANLDLDDFFSANGDSHKIRFFTNAELTARHLFEYPSENANCILELKTKGWFQLLQYKFSYCKYFQDYPNVDNWNKFFKYIPDANQDRLWKEFYSNIKDETWPECNTFTDIVLLPEYIQTEIKELFQPPANKISTDNQLLEFLAFSYYGSLIKGDPVRFDAPVYWLNDYFEYNLTPLKEISKNLKWSWDEDLSKRFHSKMLEANVVYLQWLDKMKQYYDLTISGVVCPIDLDIWEKALVIAKICQDLSCDIRTLNWQDSDCYIEQNNATIIKLLRG